MDSNSTGDWNRTNERPPRRKTVPESGAATSNCYSGVHQTCKALRPGIEPDLRASKAHVATTRRREFSTTKECPAGIEPAYLSWKPSTFAARSRTRCIFEVGRMKCETKRAISHFSLHPSDFCKVPSGSRTHTSAMARQQATATSWAQKCITTKLSKIKNAEASKEHRAGIESASPRYDGGVLPLDHQCLSQTVSSGIGENRTHIARIKSPMHYLVCHNPMCRRCCFVSVGVAGIEPATVAL